MDAATLETAPASPKLDVSRASWAGVESPWVLAATGAALWPLWSLIVWLSTPGATRPVLGSSLGVFALTAIFALMVAWIHRPEGRVLGRWIVAALGTGVMGELLAHAMSDMGTGGGIASLRPAGRALAVFGICLVIYEIGPIVAASVRVSREERRRGVADVLAYAVFLGLAALSYESAPRVGGDSGATLWHLSPWMAAVIALPLGAARAGGPRDARLPAAPAREGLLFGVALLAWAMTFAVLVADADAIERALRAMRWGTSPRAGIAWLWPALSTALSLGAAIALGARALLVRHAPHGRASGLGDGGLTLERPADATPVWVALDDGALPPEGAAVTLLGVARRAPDAGPFRDGVPQWRARRVWIGEPRALSRALARRAAGWLIAAAASLVGVRLFLGG